MAQNITLLGASYSDVPAVTLPKTGGGTATFTDTTIASGGARAEDIISGSKAYVNGSLVTGSMALSNPPTSTTNTHTGNLVMTIASSSSVRYLQFTKGFLHQDCYYQLDAGGGGTDRLVLLQTTSLGSLSTSSTSATDTGKTVSCASTTGWADYDLLLVDISVDTKTNGRHTSTVTPVILTGTSSVTTKNTYTVGANKWNSKLSSSGTASTRQSTTAYGVYINSASVSSNTLTMTVYYRYNSNSTGTLNGTYTARVYGIKLIDLIGG